MEISKGLTTQCSLADASTWHNFTQLQNYLYSSTPQQCAQHSPPSDSFTCKQHCSMYKCTHANLLVSMTDSQRLQELTKSPLQVETAQLDNPTPSTATSIGWLENDPKCSVWSLRLPLQGPGTPASSTLAWFHSFKSWQNRSWSGTALNSF